MTGVYDLSWAFPRERTIFYPSDPYKDLDVPYLRPPRARPGRRNWVYGMPHPLRPVWGVMEGQVKEKLTSAGLVPFFIDILVPWDKGRSPGTGDLFMWIVLERLPEESESERVRGVLREIQQLSGVGFVECIQGPEREADGSLPLWLRNRQRHI